MTGSEKPAGAPERRIFDKGEVIFREGEGGNEAYLLQQGKVRIFKTVSGRRVTIGHVKPFQMFGEMALLDDSTRMAAAIAEEKTVCLVISKASIRELLDGAPPGLNTVIRSMITTMRAVGDDLAVARARLAELEADDA